MRNLNYLIKSDRFFCMWLYRYVWFTGEISKDKYKFVDAADCIFWLTAAEIEKLEKK